MGPGATPASSEPKPQEATFDGPTALGDKLWGHFGASVGLPYLEDNDLYLLDEAIAILNPPEAQVRVIEVETYMESERSIAKGDIPFGAGSFSCRQMTIILKRVSAIFDGKDEGRESQSLAPASEATLVTEVGDTKENEEEEEEEEEESASAVTELNQANTAPAPISGHDAEEADEQWQKLPEIVLFWARGRRTGGNLVVCPNKSMNRLIQAYMVCEVVGARKDKHPMGPPMSDSFKGGSFKDGISKRKGRKGLLLGVELGEASAAEQDALDDLLSNYSFHDASIGVISLAASIYYFGIEGMNDVNVLTLLAVAVVAGLSEEATWPKIFHLILHCSRIEDPIVRVSQCRRVNHHQGQLSGQGFLAIGLAVFGVYLEVFPSDDGQTPLLFRIMLNVFQGGMLLVIVVNMIQAVEPMAKTDSKPQDRLRKEVKRILLEDNVFDTVWYLMLLLVIVWFGAIALVATQLSYEEGHLAWSIFIACVVVLGLSAMTINPGIAFISLWGLIWLIPAGTALVLRSAFDTTTLLIKRVCLLARRMARELVSHVKKAPKKTFSARGTLVLLVKVLPLLPLLTVFVPIPLLYVLAWTLHASLQLTLLLADIIIFPLSTLSLYPLLSDYGSVTWKMARLTMEVEDRSMTCLLKERLSELMETSNLGEMVESGVLPSKPYAHLKDTSKPELGCIALVTGVKKDDKALFVSECDPARKGRGETSVGVSEASEGGVIESAAAEV